MPRYGRIETDLRKFIYTGDSITVGRETFPVKDGIARGVWDVQPRAQERSDCWVFSEIDSDRVAVVPDSLDPLNKRLDMSVDNVLLHSCPNVHNVHCPGELFIEATPGKEKVKPSLTAKTSVIAYDGITSFTDISCERIYALNESLTCYRHLSANREVWARENMLTAGVISPSITADKGTIINRGNLLANEIKARGDTPIIIRDLGDEPVSGIILLFGGILPLKGADKTACKIWTPNGTVSAMGIETGSIHAENIYVQNCLELHGNGYCANARLGSLKMHGDDCCFHYVESYECRGAADFTDGGSISQTPGGFPRDFRFFPENWSREEGSRLRTGRPR